MKKLLLFALLTPFAALARYDSTMYVTAKSGLSLRVYQSINAPIILKIGYGEKVVSISLDSSITVEGFKTSWAKIKYRDKIGYVADIYLFNYPPPQAATEGMEDYFKQLSSPIAPAIEIGNKSPEAREEGSRIIKKMVYKNGFEHHNMHGYEFGSNMYILPDVDLQKTFQIIRGLPEFQRFINGSSAFPTASKKIDSNHRITVVNELDEKGIPYPLSIESIKFYSEDFDIGELELFEKEGQLFIIFAAGV